MRSNQRRTTMESTTTRQSHGSVSFSQLTLHKLDWLEWVAIILSIWFIIYPAPYRLLLAALLIIPLLGLILNGWNKPSMASLVEINTDRKGDGKYDVADFIDFPAFAIVFRVFYDYEFESYYSMLLPGIIACVIILTILFFTHKRIESSTRNRKWIYTSIIFCVSLYSFAATYAINCSFDNSEAKIYKTEVLGKRVHRGRKSTSYYVKVAPWGHHRDKEQIRIPAYDYNRLNVGDTVNIVFKKGVFNIPWYNLRRRNLPKVHNTL
jgi:hypothetical protein